MAAAGYSMHVPGAAADAEPGDDRQHQVLGGHARSRARPFTRTSSVLGRRCSRHCVARTWPTSLVPMPKANAPNAPWVLVWLSPQTTVRPGLREPQLGSDDVHDALVVAAQRVQLDAELAAVPLQRLQLAPALRVGDLHARPPAPGGVVGVEWSIVATVRSGRRTRSPRSRRAVKACGEVTSCTRWRST